MDELHLLLQKCSVAFIVHGGHPEIKRRAHGKRKVIARVKKMDPA